MCVRIERVIEGWKHTQRERERESRCGCVLCTCVCNASSKYVSISCLKDFSWRHLMRAIKFLIRCLSSIAVDNGLTFTKQNLLNIMLLKNKVT